MVIQQPEKSENSGKMIIIIAQTAYGLMDDKEKIMDSGFDDYLIKPIISQVLIEKLKIKSCQER